jgi:hypothetical protein
VAPLLLVTRNPALPLALATANIEFEQRHPEDLGEGSDAGPVLVALETHETAELCRRLVGQGWRGVIAAGSDSHMLAGLERVGVSVTISLPVTRDGLVSAVEAALNASGADSATSLPQQARRPRSETKAAPRDPRAHIVPGQSPAVDATPRLRELSRLPHVTSAPIVTSHDDHRQIGDAALIRDTRALVDRLPLLAEVAGGVAAQAVAATRSAAAALFLPDDDIWRVAAGVGLRTLELHVALTASDWLVNELAQLGHGIIAENSEEARKRLMGVPLATWPQVLAAPADGVGGLALVARSNEDPYTVEDLDALVAVLSAGESVLSESLHVRDLARALEPWRDRPGESLYYST